MRDEEKFPTWLHRNLIAVWGLLWGFLRLATEI
jgi:hypothetical protein